MYVISGEQIERYEKGCTFNLKKDIMEHTLQQELQKEREMVVEATRTKISKLKTAYPTGADFVWWLVIDIALNELKESLRGEP